MAAPTNTARSKSKRPRRLPSTDCSPGTGYRKLRLDEPMQVGDVWLVGVVHLDEDARKKYTMDELRNFAVPEWVPIPEIRRMIGKTPRQYASGFECPIEPPVIFRENTEIADR